MKKMSGSMCPHAVDLYQAWVNDNGLDTGRSLLPTCKTFGEALGHVPGSKHRLTKPSINPIRTAKVKFCK